MSQSTDSLLFEQSNRLHTPLHHFIRGLRKLSSYLSPLPISELLVQLEEAATPASLTKTVNTIQTAIWKQSSSDQNLVRKHMIQVLTNHVLQHNTAPVRLEAAGWLRLLLQAGLVSQPQDIFVTLVTATVQCLRSSDVTATKEQLAYLKMIFQCFWPFRYPYPAFSRELFPANEVFYPLAPLLAQVDYETQDTLIGIFGELSSLDDAEISRYLLPIALQWARHSDPERRRRITRILARLHTPNTNEALTRLLIDTEPVVRESAKSAT